MLNRDQLASILNYAFGVGMTFLLAKGFDTHTAHAVLGAVGILASFGFAWWMNHGVNGDVLLSLGRRLFALALAWLTFKGWIDGDTATAITTGLMAALPIFLSMWGYSTTAGPNLPGTTVTDEPGDDRTLWTPPKTEPPRIGFTSPHPNTVGSDHHPV